MEGRDWKVQLTHGSALVARFGRAVLLAKTEGEAQQQFLDVLLSAIQTAAAEHPEDPGRRLVRAVANLVSQADVDDVPDFGLLASTGRDVAAFVVGDVELEVSGPEGKEVVSGRDISTWVDRIVRAPFDTVSLDVPGAGDVDPRSDLGSGTVFAGGVLVSLAGAAAPAAVAQPAPAPEVVWEPEPPTAATPMPEVELPAPDAPLAATAPPEPASPQARSTAPFQAFSLTEAPPEPAGPLPTAGAEPAEEDDGAPQVQGIMCSRRHLNDPTAVYCSVCGISMVHQTHNLVWGKRPPLGVMVFDDGSVVPLTQDYVIGREPEIAPQVADGSWAALQLDDPELKVSRVHARIELRNWDVRVVDAGSANGTFVAKKGQEEWTRLVPEEPLTVTPGTRIALGSRTMEFDSPHRA